MHNILNTWRLFLEQKAHKDSKRVAKIILVNDKKQVLFLKRTDYHKKFAGEWDLPGGHVHVGEELMDGLFREVEEETGLTIKRARLFTVMDNLHFFEGVYEKGKVILSNEHSDYEFRDPLMIDNPNKFEKIAIQVVQNV